MKYHWPAASIIIGLQVLDQSILRKHCHWLAVDIFHLVQAVSLADSQYSPFGTNSVIGQHVLSGWLAACILCQFTLLTFVGA